MAKLCCNFERIFFLKTVVSWLHDGHFVNFSHFSQNHRIIFNLKWKNASLEEFHICFNRPCHSSLKFHDINEMRVSLGFIVPLENFALIWRPHHYRWWVSTFNLISALVVIEQWGFFNLQHLLWHGPTLYNGHHWGSVTLTPVAERLTVELSLPILSRPGIKPWTFACKANAIPLRNSGGKLNE